MRETLRDKCSLYADNYLKLKQAFKWEYTENNRLGALLYTMEDRPVDVAGIKGCRELIKASTGIFSQFKDVTNFTVSVMLSLKAEPDIKIRDAIKIYDALKEEGMHSSAYLVLAAVSIAFYSEPEQYRGYVARAKSFYDATKAEHRFITSVDDYTFAALLALSDKEVGPAIREIEDSYLWLKEEFRSANAVWSLSQVLSFSGEGTQVKGKRVVDLYQALKVRGCKFGLYTELPFLGIVSLLAREINTVADEIVEADNYLRNMKGFGNWSITARERLMFAAALVCDDFLADVKKGTVEVALSSTTAALLLAQQAATIAATSAIITTTAASSAST